MLYAEVIPTLLNNQWVKEEIKMESRNYLETNENIMYQNLWDAAKAGLTGNLVVINAYVQKEVDLK